MMQKFLHVEHWNVHQSEMDMHILIFFKCKNTQQLSIYLH